MKCKICNIEYETISEVCPICDYCWYGSHLTPNEWKEKGLKLEQHKKRTWLYIMPPSAYEISCDKCSGEVEWSEYEHCVWCPKCQIDTPGNDGVFSGPMPIEVMEMFGVSLDKIDLKTGERLYMKVLEDKVVWEKGEA
ncbi:MAG: hypothetical protein DRH26_02205 [Deltaproteobacteria bacterium]|nr:MAG: hypothetical protein DRH26_02205 [Deltaproteobacteria bacterium]